MKKLLSCLLACLILLSLATPTSAATWEELMEKYSPFLDYTHSQSGTVLPVPFRWEVAEKNENMTTFTPSTDGAPLMTLQTFYLEDPELNNDYFSKSDFAEILGAKTKDLKTVTLGGMEYYYTQSKTTKTTQKVKVTLTIHSWVLVEQGWIYLYRFTGDKKHELYDDFTTMISGASYGGSAADASVNTDTPGDASFSWLGGDYCGEATAGKPHGEGTLTWGTSSFTGTFENGYPRGSGTFWFADCSSKEGSDWGWTDCAYQTWLPDRQGADMYYTGMTLNDRPWGYGTLDFCSGGSFQGEFQYGDPHGEGVYTYLHPSDGKTKTKAGDDWLTVCAENRLKNEYHGLKLDGKWQGFGIGILKSGYAYCGEIKNDYRDGYGELYTKKDKLERHGLYKKGEYVKKLAQPDK